MTTHRLLPAASIGGVTALLLAVVSSTPHLSTDLPAPARVAFDWAQVTGPVHPVEDNAAADATGSGGVVVQDVSTGAFTTVPATGQDNPTRPARSQ